MSTLLALKILLVAILVIAVVRIIGPFMRSVVRRARLHGPAPYSTGGSGNAAGWAVSMLWAMREKAHEENYEYLRETSRDLDEEEQETAADPLPQVATDPLTPPDEAPTVPWLTPVLSPDGRRWWTGREWVSTERFAPASAERTEDGSQWWDGHDWHWSPGEFADDTWRPRRVDWDTGRADVGARTDRSWMERRRGHLQDRPTPRSIPLADRSDPAPTNLPPPSRDATGS